MTARRVAITGLGVICALGLDCRSFWRALSEGKGEVGPIESVDVSELRFSNGAEVRDFEPFDHFEAAHLALLDRFAQFAVVASREAVRDSALDLTSGLAQRTAVVTGSSLGGKITEEEGYVRLYREGKTRASPLTIPRAMANAGASHISMEFGLTGPVFTISTACSSAAHAIGQAFWLIRHGMADVALAGGSEAPFTLGSLKAWEAMRVISPDTCRPFSVDRNGTILGEGGAMLVLELADRARARGARVYAELAGFAMNADAHHVTHPAADGPAAAIRAAIDDAGLRPDEVDYVNAHGTGTMVNDVVEAEALDRVFGARGSHVAVSSTKGAHGHTLGAAGAIEAAATVLAVHHALVPPTVNVSDPDPRCDIDLVVGTARQARLRSALSSTFAFGGLNAVLAFRSGQD